MNQHKGESMLVYIAAPLGDPDPAVRAWHRERANLLAAMAFEGGHVPICVHAYAELAIGPDTDPAARARGLRRSMDALCCVQMARGYLWLLLRDDGTRSAGCEAELAQFLEHSAPQSSTELTWSEWRNMTLTSAPHLLPEFDRLAVCPIAPPPPQETPPA